MSNLVNFIVEKTAEYPIKELVIFLISTMPILELRGGLLAASLLKIPFKTALIICLIGNILPIPFILLFTKFVLEALEKCSFTQNFGLWLRQKIDSKKANIEKYGYIGLILFVGIPLPGTGAWTGSMIASILHMDTKKSFIAIIIGVLLACIIMSIISYGLISNIIS